jgi:recombination protein RecA
MVDLGTHAKVLEKAGAWYSFKGEKIAQGREKAKLYFQQNQSAREQLEKELREKLLTSQDISLSTEETTESTEHPIDE